MSREVCGICWCPYDEAAECGCPEFSQPSGAISSTAMLREAAQQALEALLGQRGEPDWHTRAKAKSTIAAHRARLGETK